jgi:aromatic ring-cleaving dioxygenase
MAEKSARRRKPDPRSIAECHAHIYYDPARPRRRAAHERIATEFPQARLGRWHDKLVGPHSQSMYQIAFASGVVAAVADAQS